MKRIVITGVIGWDTTAQGVRDELKNAKGEDVEFEISTPGGFVSQGLEIYNLVKNHDGATIACITGYAMSMGSYIAMAADKRVAEENAVMMIHNAHGGIYGDHNELLKYGAFVKQLSGVLAGAYARVSGAALPDIAKMMDDTTYLTGQALLDSGLVDELKGDGTDDQSALAGAQEVYTGMVAALAKDAEAVYADTSRAMAMVDEGGAKKVKKRKKEPAGVAGTQQTEVQQMNLQELLAANPAAKAEHEAALAEATAKGEQAVQKKIDQVAAYLGSDTYPKVIGVTALKVLKGEGELGTLLGAVAVVDAMREETATAAAAVATTAAGETVAQQQQTREAGALVSSDADLDAEVARFNKEVR